MSCSREISALRPRQGASGDAHNDYQAAKEAASRSMQRGIWQNRFPERFESLQDREMRSDIPRAAIDAIAHGKHFASYRGLPLAKDPFDRVLYEMLFYEIQPKTVIELGAYTGASALWMADTLKLAEIDCRVISVDLDLELVDDTARLHDGIEFLEGDLNEVDDLFPLDALAKLESPLVLIDDAHVNIAGVYEYFDRHILQAGDYLVVEDTIPWIPDTFGQPTACGDGPVSSHQPPRDWGEWKWHEVRAFFAECASDYQVDKYYTDFFGYNATWNWNGFLRKF